MVGTPRCGVPNSHLKQPSNQKAPPQFMQFRVPHSDFRVRPTSAFGCLPPPGRNHNPGGGVSAGRLSRLFGVRYGIRNATRNTTFFPAVTLPLVSATVAFSTLVVLVIGVRTVTLVASAGVTAVFAAEVSATLVAE